jgi:hypothetical protein
MNVARQDFLAGAGLAHHQHGAVAQRDAAREIDETPGARRARHRLGLGAPRARLGAGGLRQRCFVSLGHPTSHHRVTSSWERVQKACRAETGAKA